MEQINIAKTEQDPNLHAVKPIGQNRYVPVATRDSGEMSAECSPGFDGLRHEGSPRIRVENAHVI